MTRGYDDLGRVVSILTSEAGSNPIQDLTYSYDKLGNLKTRDDAGMAGMPFVEVFSYDGLSRLTDVQLTITGQAAADTLDISYDLSGRITNKNGDTYSYAQGQVIHGMTSMSNGYTAIYDANGEKEHRHPLFLLVWISPAQGF